MSGRLMTRGYYGRFLLMLGMALPCSWAATSASATDGPDPATPPVASNPGPVPVETMHFADSPTYSETQAYLGKLAAASKYIQVSSCGYTTEGYPIPVVFVSDRTGPGGGWDTDPRKPTIMITAGIHSGEICGNDALQLLLRDIAQGRESDLVSHVRLVLVPIFNVDGHRNKSPTNRFTQNGPAGGFGTRRNALNLDLNRDFTKLDSPEVEAIVRLFTQFQPDIYIDLHTDDGIGHQYDLLFSPGVNPTYPGKRDQLVREELVPYVNESMRKDGFLSHWIGYAHDRKDPRAGISIYGLSQRTGYGYFETRHCISILTEAYPYNPYERRVRATYSFVRAVLEYAVRNRIHLTETIQAARKEAILWGREPGQHEIALGCTADTTRSRQISWLGKGLDLLNSEVTGREYAVYNDRDVTYEVPYHDQLVPRTTVTMPRGYLILPAYRHVMQKLKQHGIGVHLLDAPTDVEVESYTVEGTDYRTKPYQGHFNLKATGRWQTEVRTIPAGSCWVPLDQPAGFSAMHLLEPDCGDALLSWNAFDTITERGIILEDWALEENARELLKDPAIRAEYEEALNDSSFANDADAKLEFFFQMTPYPEPWQDLYPVFRVRGDPPSTGRW